jgi:hypothetical protein
MRTSRVESGGLIGDRRVSGDQRLSNNRAGVVATYSGAVGRDDDHR